MTQPILTAEEILAWNEKTAQGWRIKKRQFVPSKTQLPPREPAPGASTRPQR